ncbi:MAG: NTP transferase domain-containing protein [Deltaproteobacteria bacterium]|nr:NTP transferase domain-containing protein [Deltaproteobacteria bacterium]
MKTPLLAIVQARMGSTRLPGKSLKPICGKPLIFHVVERLELSRRITDIVVATSESEKDTPLAHALDAAGVGVVRGSEHNVLLRFAKAANGYTGNYLVRVTGDAPFVDAMAIDRMVDTLAEANVDFFDLAPGVAPIHEGFEVFSRSAFERLLQLAGTDAVAMEHVTGYFKLHPEFVSRVVINVPESEQFAGARMSVDTPADIVFVETVYQRLGCHVPYANVTDIVSLLRAEPALLRLNQHVRQKALTHKALRVAFICESGGVVGYGHLSRILALAEVLRDAFSCANRIYVMGDQDSVNRVHIRGLWAMGIDDHYWDKGWLDEAPDVAVIDVLNRLTPQTLMGFEQMGIQTVLIDDGSDRRLVADMVCYAAVPQVDDMNWERFSGQMLRGFEYAIVDPVYIAPPKRTPQDMLRLLVSMGGSDPADFTQLSLRALSLLQSPVSLHVTVVIGPGCKRRREIETAANALSATVSLVIAPENLRDLMEASDMAMVSFGVTAYEAAAMELPAVYLCLSDDHAKSASPFVDAGVATVGGVYPAAMDAARLSEAIETMMVHCREMYTSGGVPLRIAEKIRQGTMRVAEEIMQLKKVPTTTMAGGQ